MKHMRRLYEMFMEASVAHAKWDYETSMNILNNKKKLWTLAIMLIPAALTGFALAADQ